MLRVCVKKRVTDSNTVHPETQASPKTISRLTFRVTDTSHSPILPGLPDDVAKHCLALVPRTYIPAMGGVSKKWRGFIKSKEFITIRGLAGVVEEWVYVLSKDNDGNGSFWEVLNCEGNVNRKLPRMPGPVRVGFGVVVVNGKIIVMAGQSVVDGIASVSSDVYQYDSCLNSWSKLANMNVARYDFACAEVKGKVYAVGGYGLRNENLSCAEVYDPDTDKWTVIESLHRPRWGCFGCEFEGKLYIMGGRSSFTIGYSKKVDIYTPESQNWDEMKNGCVMVTAHAVLENKLFCMEWKNHRKLSIFDPVDNSWKIVQIPIPGNSSIGFKFGVLDGKLLLFSLKEKPGYSNTLLYDPNGKPGLEWGKSKIKSSGMCLCSVTIRV